MMWIKAFHIAAMVSWFSGMFYLPRLFVYHAMAADDDIIGKERFKIMERKLYNGIMTPGAVLTMILGFWLVYITNGMEALSVAYWLHVKLLLVVILVVYHVYCGYLVRIFAADKNTKSHVYYRWLNEFPVVLLLGIVILAVVKPF